MNANIQLLRNHAVATATDLRRVGWPNFHNLAPGLDSLVCEQFAEHTQTHVMSRAGKIAVLKHEVEVQILQYNRAVGIHQLPCDFVPPIPALVSDVFVLFGQLANHLAAALAALFAPANFALQAAQLLKRLL